MEVDHKKVNSEAKRNGIMARKAGLQYMTDSAPGFSRIKKGKNQFKYLDQKGRILTKKSHLARIRSLVIPPAWNDVWICPSPLGHIQVTGFDVRKRKQYRYHAEWNKIRNENKFNKMVLFAEKLPLIRRRIKKDIKMKGLGRDKILASIIQIMEKTLIRIGNEEYAKNNHSFGLTTIRNNHVKIRGSHITFDFKGKSGKQHHVEMDNESLATIVRQCQELPGQELFAYKDDDGKVQNISSQHVNSYLQEITGEPITAKDFRTWGGTVCATLFLKTKEIPQSEGELKRLLVEAVTHTSKTLRNTPTICRKYYIHPVVFQAFEKGKLAEFSTHSAELMTKNLLKTFTAV